MKNNVLSFLIAVLFFSCSGKNVEVQRISNLEYVVVSDSIYTRMPGTILYQDGIVFWEDPISFDNIIHAVDVKNRTELLAFGNRGEGPNDFTETIMSLDSEGGIIVNDLNKPLEIHFQVNIDKKSVSFSSYKYDCDNKATRLLYLDKGKVLYHYPEAEKMFQVKENTSEYSFGERPIKEKMNNAYDIFQGQIAYNPQRRLLVYSNLIFPYLSIYKRLDSEGWSQIGEWKENLDYTSEETLKITLINLLNNAVDALTDAAEKETQKWIRCRIEASSNELTIDISDNGPGIAEKNADSLFVPFFTTKDYGTGLGLYTVSSELEKLGGTIQLDAEYREGARFIVKIPAQEEGEEIYG